MIRSVFLAGLVVALACSAAAHQQRVASAEVLLNARSGFVEVAHRFSIHDAEHALALADGERPDLIGSAAARESFAAYVADSFSIVDGRGEPLELTILGSEIEGGHIWIYQEAPLPSDPSGMSMRHGAFHEIWSDQRTLVTVKSPGGDTSLLFEDDLTLPVVF
ncbi:MAG: DUF6702 family protein [Pseudomonadota bacterium]